MGITYSDILRVTYYGVKKEMRACIPALTNWFPGNHVCPSALVLHFRRRRRSLDDLFNYESCCLKMTLDFRRLKEEKTHRDRMAPQFLLVSSAIAHVEYEEKLPARLEHSLHLAKHHGQKFIWNIHDGIESDDPGERFIREIQSHHVAFTENDIRVQPSSLLQHAGREIQAEDGCARVAQVASNVTRPATHVTYVATSLHFSRKAIEQFAVQGFVLEFVGNSFCVLRREPIVVLAKRGRDFFVHWIGRTECSNTRPIVCHMTSPRRLSSDSLRLDGSETRRHACGWRLLNGIQYRHVSLQSLDRTRRTKRRRDATESGFRPRHVAAA